VGADLARRLLDAGTAVFAIDLRYHGERSALLDYMAPMYLTFENSLHVRNRDMIVQSTIDARRALDVLRTRADVDSARLGVVGQSLGGMVATYLGALEPTLAGLACASTPSHPQLLPADHYSFASRARVPVLLMAGRKDWHTSPEDTQTLLAMFPHRERRVVFYDSGHSLPTAWTTEASAWLLKRLGAGDSR
jgi:dienelactone hydrolase